MYVFCVGGPAEALEELEEYYRSFVGLNDIIKKKETLWILCFEDRESAVAAQWQMEVNGAKG